MSGWVLFCFIGISFGRMSFYMVKFSIPDFNKAIKINYCRQHQTRILNLNTNIQGVP